MMRYRMRNKMDLPSGVGLKRYIQDLGGGKIQRIAHRLS